MLDRVVNTPLSSLHRYLPFFIKDVSMHFGNTTVLKYLENPPQNFVRKDLYVKDQKRAIFINHMGEHLFFNECQNIFRLYSPLE